MPANGVASGVSRGRVQGGNIGIGSVNATRGWGGGRRIFANDGRERERRKERQEWMYSIIVAIKFRRGRASEGHVKSINQSL